jgi:uncharacterized protein YqhQ
VSGQPGKLNSEGEAAIEAPRRASGEWARAKDTEGVVCQTHVGGQALIEGIMMRGKYNWAVAVREPGGTIYLEEHDLASGRNPNSWHHKPVLRGCTALVESLALGYKALEIASAHAFDLEEEQAKEDVDDVRGHQSGAGVDDVRDRQTDGDGDALGDSPQANTSNTTSEHNSKNRESDGKEDGSQGTEGQEAKSPEAEGWDDDGQGSASQESEGQVRESQENGGKEGDSSGSGLPKPLVTISMVVGLLLGVALFIVLPAFITNLIIGDYGEKTLLWNLVDGVLRIAVFVFYIWLIGRMNDIKRMFAYHGAEHKTIHCYEHGLELTVDNARSFPTLHVRCGTAFMLMTMLIAILVFTLAPVAPLIDALGVTNGIVRLALVILSRIILLPLIAGLSYEVTVKWAGAHPESPFVQFILWPGMQMQRLTTNAPDDGMLECAIKAMQLVLEREQREQAAKQVKVEG